MRIILASQSPRRRELLGDIYSSFEVITSEADESLPDGMPPSEGTELLAVRKGRAVRDMLLSRGEDLADTIIISADTLVELNGRTLGKPTDEDDAINMLSSLSGSTHHVHTGMAVHYMDKVYSGVDTTNVIFRDVERWEIEEYVSTGEPMDKSGSYAIQSGAEGFVKEIRGDIDTVVGLSSRLLGRLVTMALEGR